MKKLFTLSVLVFCLAAHHSLFSQCDYTLSEPLPCASTPVTFTIDTPSGSYGWDFDNNGFIDVFGSSVTYSFPESNIDLGYTVVL